MESAEMLALKAANEALVARVAVLEAGVKSKSEKKVVVKAKPAQHSPIAAAAAVLLAPKIPEGTLVRHLTGSVKKGNVHAVFAKMLGGRFVECNEDGSAKEGAKAFTSSPSNFGSQHYKDLMEAKHPSVVGRKQVSCNGWTEVEYRKEDGSWAETNLLRPQESIKHVTKPVVVTLGPMPGASNAAAGAGPAAVPAEQVVAEVVAVKTVRKKLVKVQADLPVLAAAAAPPVPVAPVEDAMDSQVTDEGDEVPEFEFLFCETVEERKVFIVFQDDPNCWKDADFIKAVADDTLEEFKTYAEMALQADGELDLTAVDFSKVRLEMRAWMDVLRVTED